VLFAPYGRWRVIAYYASFAAEVCAAIAIGLVIVILALMLNASFEPSRLVP
jgi:hypothetical protein